MPGYRTHSLSAFLTFPLVTLLYKCLAPLTKGTPLSWDQISTGFVLYLLSSQAPDIDHKQAYSNRLFFFFLWMVLTLAVFRALFTHGYYLLPPVFDPVIEEALFVLSLAGGGLVSFVCFKLLPVHRGPIHTFLFGLVYALALGALYWYLFENLSTEKAALSRLFFIFMCALLGFLNHLLLDSLSGRLKR